ncbi:RBBP9/YdeN family alpha/beta hydrolase [Ralstonia mojiangensis]|uniref:Alpha/beta fold hydrolase n=1 Tax=Ralstonia mojiangensis TaxID=2953895 RepID=A0AAE3LB25_9RALS|nr:alpha/beta fold hydrolase [Ralstonia mojiangensis]MCO5412641.1 alpha/beta fold hydrolase [Ralstonia mojiangensis]MCT7316535.1 alpha/beta fold hydrolase [Ralstonia mojiangensis]
MARSALATASDASAWQWPADAVILTVPGLHGSGPGHWQTRWEQRFPAWRRVVQTDWSTPDLPRWSARVGEAVHAALAERPPIRARRPVILVAHSFGCLAALHWAVQTKEAVAAALLVAPADPDKFGVRDLLPDHALPFPITLVASRNDPWMPQGSAIDWGARWGAEFIDAGEAGHINADSNLGDWDAGLTVLDRLIGRASAEDTTRDGADWQAQWDVLPSTPYI